MIVIGHRGCYYPGFNQNTIRSFQKVVDEGVPAIEFDVQLCRDGELAIVHNLYLDEVSTGVGPVSETDSVTLKQLFAGKPERGIDRIPFLFEVFDFFASVEIEKRPQIHLELKGDLTGIPSGELINSYIDSGKLLESDFLISSFNWDELRAIRKVCPEIKIGLLGGALHRSKLLERLDNEGEEHFPDIFSYGNEEFMRPSYPVVADNLEHLKETCPDERIRAILADEIRDFLSGKYYNEEMLNMATEMNAYSVHLWSVPLQADFVAQAHERGLLVFVYTVNDHDDLLKMAEMGVDGVFTDYFSESKEVLADYL